jgi:phospholysine phosphohistidine inorganic pyrophosphate phosphatase
MDAVLFDLDGVFYEGGRPVAGGAETLAWFRERSIPYVFLTNTTSRPRTALVEKLAGFGMETEPAQFLTPAVAAAGWLKGHASGKTALFVPEATRAEFAAIALAGEGDDVDVSAVVVGDLGERWDFATLNRAFRLLMGDPPAALLALGMTRYWRAPDGLRLDTAPFVVALAHASGAEPVVLGKPSPAFFRAALDRVGSEVSRTVIVGDDIVGDIGGARGAGIGGVLVRTGKFRETDLEKDIRPEALIDSIADLPAWWRESAR